MLITRRVLSSEDYSKYCRDMRSRRTEYPKKIHTLGVFNLKDVAEAAGVSTKTVSRRMKRAGYSVLKDLSLKDLVLFIKSI